MKKKNQALLLWHQISEIWTMCGVCECTQHLVADIIACKSSRNQKWISTMNVLSTASPTNISFFSFNSLLNQIVSMKSFFVPSMFQVYISHWLKYCHHLIMIYFKSNPLGLSPQWYMNLFCFSYISVSESLFYYYEIHHGLTLRIIYATKLKVECYGPNFILDIIWSLI